MKISFFPDDDITRIVYAVGSIPCSTSFISNPLVNVFLAPIYRTQKGEQDSRFYPKLISIPATELDIVRVGTIWKGQELGYSYYNFTRKNKDINQYEATERKFEIDYLIDNGYFVKRNETKSNVGFFKSNLDSYVIDFNYFNLPDDSFIKYKGNMNIKNSYLYSIQCNGIIYYIPCLEILTSLYAPMRKDLRRMILTHTKDEIIKRYVDITHKSHQVIPNKKVKFKLKENLGDTSVIFLAHLLASEYTNKAFDLIKLTINSEDNFNIYPKIKPYFQGNVIIQGNGIILNQEGTEILVSRIDGFVAPSNIEVVLIEELTINRQSTSGIELEETERLIAQDGQLSITYENSSSYIGNRKNYVLSEVQISIQEGLITRETELKYREIIDNNNDDSYEGLEEQNYANETVDIINPEFEIITNLITGERIYNKKGKYPSTEIKLAIPQINQETVHMDVFNAIVELSHGEDKILDKISNFEGFHSENLKDFLITYESYFDIERETWVVRNDNQYRQLMLLQLYFSKEKFNNFSIEKKYYLLEIVRRDAKQDSYSGFLFATDTKFTKDTLHNIMISFAKNKGNGELIKNNLLRSNIKMFTYRHSKGMKTWEQKMHKTLVEKFNLTKK